MKRRFFLKGAVSLGGALFVGCEAVGKPSIVDMMHEAGYILATATYNGREGTVVRGFNGTSYAAAGDGPLSDGTQVVIMKVNDVVIRDAFLEDIERDDNTIIQPMVVPFKRSLAHAG